MTLGTNHRLHFLVPESGRDLIRNRGVTVNDSTDTTAAEVGTSINDEPSVSNGYYLPTGLSLMSIHLLWIQCGWNPTALSGSTNQVS